MKYKKFGEHYCIKLEKGDKIIEEITEMCKKENIKLGFFNGIGAVDNVTLSIFDTTTKEYSESNIKKDLEIANISGNVTQLDGEVLVHSHIVLSDEKMGAFGGHLKEGIISVTGEIVLRKVDGLIKREKDEDIGLNLWSI